MKLSITIDMSPEEIIALTNALQKGRTEPSAPLPAEIVEDLAPEPFKLVRVADCKMNKVNSFWEQRVGQIGRVVDEREGMWDVHFADEPFPCKDVDPQRFTPVTA